MSNATAAPVAHADRFFIGGEWVAPSSDATIDVIDSGDRRAVLHGRRRPRPTTSSRAVAAARHAFDEGPWPRLSHARARRVPPRAGRGSRSSTATCSAQLWPRESGTLYKIVAVRRPDRIGRARGVRGTGRHVPVRGGVPADERRRVRPARARTGRRRRRDHPVERAGRAHLPQDRSRAPRRLHRRAQVVAGSAGRGLRVRGGRARRSVCRPASSTS